MIDWPNAIIGFLLGIGATLPFWIHDRLHARLERHRDLWAAWKVAMKEIELLMWKPETRASDLYIARTRFPIDHWRTVVDDRTGFVLLERLERAYASIEHFGNQYRQLPSRDTQNRFFAARDEWTAARIDFANYSRSAQSDGYTELVLREELRRRRHDLVRHPIRTVRRKIGLVRKDRNGNKSQE